MASGIGSTPIRVVSKIGVKGLLSDSKSEEDDASLKELALNFKRKDPPKKHREKSAFAPKIYLSIVISGLPPDNSLQLIVQNMKLDKNNLRGLMETINYRLSTIEHTLRKGIQKKTSQSDLCSQGSLQAHLHNAQYVLDLMN